MADEAVIKIKVESDDPSHGPSAAGPAPQPQTQQPAPQRELRRNPVLDEIFGVAPAANPVPAVAKAIRNKIDTTVVAAARSIEDDIRTAPAEPRRGVIGSSFGAVRNRTETKLERRSVSRDRLADHRAKIADAAVRRRDSDALRRAARTERVRRNRAEPFRDMLAGFTQRNRASIQSGGRILSATGRGYRNLGSLAGRAAKAAIGKGASALGLSEGAAARVAMAFGGVAVAATAAVTGLMAIKNIGLDLASRAGQYSPEVAMAQALGDIRNLLGDMARAQSVGGPMAKVVEIESRMNNLTEDIKAGILKVVDKVGVLDSLNKAVQGFALIFGSKQQKDDADVVLDQMFDFFLGRDGELGKAGGKAFRNIMDKNHEIMDATKKLPKMPGRP